MIITIVNEKGGVGKTTVAINLSYCIAGKGYRTLLIDADPQGSVLKWKSIADNKTFDVKPYPDPLTNLIRKLAKGYQHTVIDTPPGIGDATWSTLLGANLAIIPITPSPFDIWASNDIIQLVRKAKEHNKNLIGALVISKKIAGTLVGRDIRNTLAELKMGIFNTEIAHRMAYVNAAGAGLSVVEYAPNSKAAKEMKSLCDEIVR
ncbi:ParA family partition ATPase [Desulfococcaceae bacterium HSG8]|nr:ParA family partition ATPase [Desulfococcaceae bacterium HSG8]